MLENIYYASLHDTDDSHIKTLVIVKTKRTEFYQMKILEDGGIEMTLNKVCTSLKAQTVLPGVVAPCYQHHHKAVFITR